MYKRQVPGDVGGYAEVAQRVARGEEVAGAGGEGEGALQGGEGGGRVAPDDLVERTGPEERLALAPGVAELPVARGGPLEQLQLARVLDPVRQEPGVQHPPPGQREVRLDPVQPPLRRSESTCVAAEHGCLVVESGLFDPYVPGHVPIVGRPLPDVP